MSEPLQQRAGNTVEWVATDYLLRKAEWGFEYDVVTGEFIGAKVGDGITRWNALGYFVGATPVADPDAPGVTVANNLTTNEAAQALSAAQGVVLKALADQATLTSATAVGAATAASTSASQASVTATNAVNIAAAAETEAAAATALAETKLSSLSGSVATANLADQAVSSAKMAFMPTKTYLGRSTSGTGAVEAVPAATLAADLGLAATATDIAYSIEIPLDNAGFGSRMPEHNLTAAVTLSMAVSPAPVDGGTCEIRFKNLGNWGLSYPASWILATPDTVFGVAAGDRTRVVIERVGTDVFIYLFPLTGIDIINPLALSVAVEDAAPSVAVVLYDEDLDQSQNATTFAAAHAISAGHAIVSSAWGNTLRKLSLTLGTPFVNGESAKTLAFTQSGAIALQDAAANKVASYSGLAITNNVALLVPGAPTIAQNGSATYNTVTIAATLPGSGGTPTDIRWEYKLAADGSYTSFNDDIDLALVEVITGLTASNSYNFRARLENAAGYGPYSNVLTVSTPAQGNALMATLTDNFAGTTVDFTTKWRLLIGGLLTFTNGSATVARTAHGFSVGDQIQLGTNGTLPTPFTTAAIYFVSATNFTANSFELSLTNGGASVVASSAGSGAWHGGLIGWSGAGTPGGVTQNNKLILTTPGTGFRRMGMHSRALYDLTDSAVYAKIYGNGGTNVSHTLMLRSETDGTDSFWAIIQTGITGWSSVNGTETSRTTVTWPAEPTWIRLRHVAAGDLLKWDTAPDSGSNTPGTWTERASFARTFDITAMRFSILVTQHVTATATTFDVGGLNTTALS